MLHPYYLAAAQNIVDIQDGDSLVVLNRRGVTKGWDVPYDDQRLTMKAVVLGTAKTDVVHSERQKISDDAARTIIYHRCGGCMRTHVCVCMCANRPLIPV